MTDRNTNNVDVLVIGGGISGLYCANFIKKKAPHLSVLVLEAKDRLGGRTLTMNMKTKENGNDYFDIGGQWVTDTQKNVTQLLKELGLETYKQYHKGKSIVEINTCVQSYSLPLPFVSLLSFLETIYSIFKLEYYVSKVPMWNPMDKHDARKLDTLTLKCLMKPLINNIAYPLMSAATRTIFGAEPEQINALFALTYAQAGGGFMKLSLTDAGCAQELKIKGGSQEISKLLAKQIGEKSVLLEKPVQKIIQSKNSVPLEFEPMLPGSKRELMKHMPVGSYIKFIFTFEKAFWRENGFSGEVISDGSWSMGQAIGPMTYLIDGTSCHDSPALLGFIGGKCAAIWTNVSMEERRDRLCECLTRYFGKDCFDYIDYLEKYLRKRLWKDFSIHFAGTETASVWMGYMDGAIDAGRRAACEVLHALAVEPLSTEDLACTYQNRCTEYEHKKREKSQYPTYRYLFSFIVVVLAFLFYIVYTK
ncbi:unnamed protein product [Didymodactylos carnosus]|uniref:Amine oxidase n=3 Tax=Didymodactylos carnosus TaxID=1234261 RepID=A0A814FA40_9BILA|nr:unnamed protein product [Didymodactylos carnosus]CAF3755452.1 unnamed protein product [Didymodactylos carnosus]